VAWMRWSISAESPVNVHGSEVFALGCVLLSAVKWLKQKRRRLIWWVEPVVTESEHNEPSAISNDAETQSSVSMGLTRVAVRANTLWAGPRI